MKYDPAEPWEKKIETVRRIAARVIAARSNSRRQAVEHISERSKTPLGVILDLPLRRDPQMTQADLLLSRAVDPLWWAGEIRSIREGGRDLE